MYDMYIMFDTYVMNVMYIMNVMYDRWSIAQSIDKYGFDQCIKLGLYRNLFETRFYNKYWQNEFLKETRDWHKF